MNGKYTLIRGVNESTSLISGSIKNICQILNHGPGTIRIEEKLSLNPGNSVDFANGGDLSIVIEDGDYALGIYEVLR